MNPQSGYEFKRILTLNNKELLVWIDQCERGWEEVYGNTQDDLFNMDIWIKYFKKDQLLIFGLFKDNNWVGHVSYTLSPLSIPTNIIVNELSFYIYPEHRKGYLANSLLKYSLEELKLLNTKRVTFIHNDKLDLDNILIRNDFKPTNTVYEKLL